MAAPLGAGTISLGLSPGPGPAATVVDGLRRAARQAVDAGFDGVTLSEHHAGFPGYLPTPLLMAGVLLADLPRGWAVACPSILPLRGTATVAEDLAWLAAAYPGRVGAGFVPGYQPRDFAVTGADFEARHRRYWAQLSALTATLAGRPGGLDLAADPAIRACRPAGLPIVSGVAGPRGAQRAAAAGAGLLIMSLAAPERAASLVAAHRAAGGPATAVLIRRARLGPPAPLPERGWSRAAATDPDWLRADDGAVVGGAPDEVAERLAAAVHTAGSTALNIRIENDGPDQIARFGAEVLPRVRAELSERPVVDAPAGTP
jgi:alkanesulfonate monooxygenase SsuD/methylene tetrahydromethanopterin reductase-like flavin-dependent oxidoreductase (luciferase family)